MSTARRIGTKNGNKNSNRGTSYPLMRLIEPIQKRQGGGESGGEVGKSKIGDRRLSTRDFIRGGELYGFTAPQAACMEDANFAVACPLAFYRINLRPIRRTAIFNGSSDNSLLCTVKGQSPSLSASKGEEGGGGTSRKTPAGQKWRCAHGSPLSLWLFFHKMAHCCVSLPPPSVFLFLFRFQTRSFLPWRAQPHLAPQKRNNPRLAFLPFDVHSSMINCAIICKTFEFYFRE